MKKKLEAELISIAHRILKMKNKSDLVQLHQETQKLYEKLSVLRFVEENFSERKPTIGYTEIEDQLAVIFDQDSHAEDTEQVAAEAPAVVEAKVEEIQPEAGKDDAISDILSGISEKASQQQEKVEAVMEQEELAVAEEHESALAEAVQAEETEQPEPIEEEAVAEPSTPVEEAITETPAPTEEQKEDAFKPAFEWGFEPKKEEPKITPAQISFDDLLGQDYVDPVFVKPEEVETPMPTKEPAAEISEDERRAAELAESNRRLADLREAANKPLSERVIPISRNFSDTSNVIPITKSENLNDRVSKGITIGLNDRIAFMKHLFNNSSEDYNRVLSQLITFDTLNEAQSFIDTMVKPDYNNWEGKEEYEQRFMEIVEKKFS